LIKYTNFIICIFLFVVLFPRQRQSNSGFCVFVTRLSAYVDFIDAKR
jgi:hypothetical protein